MFITKETDYAIRMLRSLSTGEKKSIGEISDVELIPKPFAYKIAKKLEKNDLIQIDKGAQGGCFLICNLSDVTLYDLIGCMDGRLEITTCFQDGYECQWREEHAGCKVHHRLAELQKQVNDLTRRYSIQDLIM